jgi:FkbM family methyltransferase
MAVLSLPVAGTVRSDSPAAAIVPVGEPACSLGQRSSSARVHLRFVFPPHCAARIANWAIEMATKCLRLDHRGRSLTVLDHPAVTTVLPAFLGAFEASTLDVFDAVLPGCATMVDIGAHVGLTALYAAAHGARVTAFEPNPQTFALLEANLALNPMLASRIVAIAAALAEADGRASLFAKGNADSGSSLHRAVERGGILAGHPTGMVTVRDAAAVLAELNIARTTLVKLDAEGAEYRILPRIAALLAERQPYLHVSFHPFNLVADSDPYATQLLRLRACLDAAMALASYPFMYAFSDGRWVSFGAADRLDLLRRYLLVPKPVAGIGTPQFGFIDGWTFSPAPIPALEMRAAA